MTVEIDDRVTCLMCVHSERFRCTKLGVGMLVELARRCIEFVPNPQEGDQRTGRQRWPTLTASIAAAREDDAAHRKVHG